MQAEKISSINSQQAIKIEYGTVQDTDNDQFIIQSSAGIFTAKQAFSCLVKPQTGDRIMYSCDDKQLCHILAIIERPTNQDATLIFPGDVAIDSSRGKMSITSSNGIQMTSAESIVMVSSEMDVIAKKGLINIDDASITGNQLTSTISSIRTFAKSIDTVADRISQKFKNSFRLIEGVDQTKAGEMLTTIKNLYSLRSRQSAIIAKKDIKIDAERIHMG